MSSGSEAVTPNADDKVSIRDGVIFVYAEDRMSRQKYRKKVKTLHCSEKKEDLEYYISYTERKPVELYRVEGIFYTKVSQDDGYAYYRTQPKRRIQNIEDLIQEISESRTEENQDLRGLSPECPLSLAEAQRVTYLGETLSYSKMTLSKKGETVLIKNDQALRINLSHINISEEIRGILLKRKVIHYYERMISMDPHATGYFCLFKSSSGKERRYNLNLFV